ncbi:MAG: arginine--tRNA ligase, partial [Myxococcales bacterium]|nr:arginine--tRNA ligase [Myxococcales bacterium]
MRERLVQAIQGALETLLAEAGAEAEVPAFAVEVPRQADHGDFACNAAMLLAKALRKPPREIAQRLAEVLGDAGGLVARTEIAGPGFLNLWLAGARWQDVLGRILEADAEFGRSDTLKGARIQVEFVSANPTGPLSIGHGRQAVLGDCIARLLDAVGADVTREY